MLVFVIVFLLLFFLRDQKNKVSTLTIIAILFCIGFLREQTVGTDVLSYCSIISGITTKSSHEDVLWLLATENIEVGFTYMIMGLRYISDSPMFIIRLLFLLYFSCITYWIAKCSEKPNLSYFVYYSLAFYFFSFNGIRQALALSFALVIISYFFREKNKTVWKAFAASIAIVVISVLFHRSVIICALVPFIIKYKDVNVFSNRILILLLIVSIILSVFFTNTISQSLSGIDISFLGSEKYSSYMERINVDSSFSFVSNILHALFAIYLLYTTKERNVWLLIYSIGTILLVLLSPLTWLFIRVADNLNIFIVLAIPFVYREWKSNKSYTVYKTAVFLYCTVLFFNRLKDDNGDVTPYQWILF